ncbi:hypothetical protein SLE2022_104700 [Rubroshorea leprosula]
MGKQSRSKKPENFGKGKVTPIQVAFIVDRYLSDNNFSETRSVFRTEASSLISKSPVREAPRSLLSLGAMLDEYICLKEQKMILEQERVRLEQEKCRVHALLQGMQNVMNAYNASASGSVPMIPNASIVPKSVAAAPPSISRGGSPPGHTVYGAAAVLPVSGPPNPLQEHGNFSTPVTSLSTRKKRGSEAAMEASAAAKKTRSKTTSMKLTNQGTDKRTNADNTINNQLTVQPSSVTPLSPQNCPANELTVQVSTVAKCLFNQTQLSPPCSSSCPNTPPQSSQIDKSITPIAISPTANCSNNNTPQEITPTICTISSTERARLTPLKQMTCYTIERSHCISSCSPAKTNLKRQGRRDHVKGRLDFGGSDVTGNLDQPIANDIITSDPEKQADYFDIDFPSLDAFAENFSFSELLLDFDLGCEAIAYPCQPTPGASGDTVSGSSHESGDGNLGTNQVMSEFSSTVTEVLSEKDGNAQGPELMTSVKSITKCIRILSPAKGCRNSLGQQNCSASN